MSLTDKDINLIDKLLKGDRAALARLISRIEDNRADASSILREINPHTGNAYTIGITGPPGAGKSTFVNSLTALFRQQGKKVGVIAVDPSSPFTGGAVLGDRIRMQDHTADKDVFIRSIGSRGSQGGLSKATAQILKLYDAYGFDIVMIETVGVGQTELDIIRIADTVLVILVPESGDVVQSMKAGLMEIADIFIVNKADREGAEKISRDIRSIASESGSDHAWQIPVLLTTANKNEGIDEAAGAIEDHNKYQQENNLLEKKLQDTRKLELIEIILEKFEDRLSHQFNNPEIEKIVREVQNGSLQPYEGADLIIKKLD